MQDKISKTRGETQLNSVTSVCLSVFSVAIWWVVGAKCWCLGTNKVPNSGVFATKSWFGRDEKLCVGDKLESQNGAKC